MALRLLCPLMLFLLGPVAAPGLADRAGLLSAATAQESVRVWVNTRSGVYHCPGSRYYGSTKSGEFMAEAEARAGGNRPAYGRVCGSVSGSVVPPRPLSTVGPAADPSAGSTVWVNTRSGVYHCPGSQYYGNTKSGKYMTEAEARSGGNRPAYGRTCG